MKLFLDSAIIKDIDKRLDAGVISGVTTNPTLIKKSGREPDDVYADLIQDLGVQDVSIEVDAMRDQLTQARVQRESSSLRSPPTTQSLQWLWGNAVLSRRQFGSRSERSERVQLNRAGAYGRGYLERVSRAICCRLRLR